MKKLGRDFSSSAPYVVPRTKVRRYGKEILRLADAYGRRLKPKEVVEEARSKKSPLHGYFEWNNLKAAQSFRLQQARKLLEVVYVTVIDTRTGKEVPARSMVNVFTEEKGRKVRAYVRQDDALNTPYYRAQLVAQALDELEGWCAKYNVYEELKDTIHEVLVLSRFERKKLFQPAKKSRKRRKATVKA